MNKLRSERERERESKSALGTSQAFTLIELLVVIAVIAILSIVVILTLNPAQILMSGRDANRVSDMATLTDALQAYTADQSNGSLGSSSVVYVSIPDPTATSSLGDQCQGIPGLPYIPSSYSYHCAASSTFRSVNGTGWIPVNFNAVSFGSPLGILPVDPVNQTSSNLYYTYDTNGSQFQLGAHMESQKYIPLEANSGGTDPATYTAGTNLSLAPFVGGMVGYWPLNEGSGTTIYDGSGWGDNGIANGTTWLASSCPAGGCLYFNGSGYVNIANPSSSLTGNISISLWMEPSGTMPSSMAIINKWYASEFFFYGEGGGTHSSNGVQYQGGGNFCNLISTNVIVSGLWQQLVFVRNGTTLSGYYDGTLQGTCTVSNPTSSTTQPIQLGTNSVPGSFIGLIDNVRIYNSRALSSAEIAAMYAGGK